MTGRNATYRRGRRHLQASTRDRGNEEHHRMYYEGNPSPTPTYVPGLPTPAPRTHPIPPAQEGNQSSLGPDWLAYQLQFIQISNPQPQPLPQPQIVPIPTPPIHPIPPSQEGNHGPSSPNQFIRPRSKSFEPQLSVKPMKKGKGKRKWTREENVDLMKKILDFFRKKNHRWAIPPEEDEECIAYVLEEEEKEEAKNEEDEEDEEEKEEEN